MLHPSLDATTHSTTLVCAHTVRCSCSLCLVGYAKIHIPIISSVSEHQPTAWPHVFMVWYFPLLCKPHVCAGSSHSDLLLPCRPVVCIQEVRCFPAYSFFIEPLQPDQRARVPHPLCCSVHLLRRCHGLSPAVRPVFLMLPGPPYSDLNSHHCRSGIYRILAPPQDILQRRRWYAVEVLVSLGLMSCRPGGRCQGGESGGCEG
jgi:hypothetical protein